jgi:hypothetical protein
MFSGRMTAINVHCIKRLFEHLRFMKCVSITEVVGNETMYTSLDSTFSEMDIKGIRRPRDVTEQ